MNYRHISIFLERLRKAKHFEDAAETMLRQMLDVAKTALHESRYAKRGRILRAMAHLRPADGYQRLVVLDDAVRPEVSGIAYIPSASAFRWVSKHDCPI